MNRFKVTNNSISPIIERLKHTNDVREAEHLIHDLGNLDIGKESWGYTNFHTEYEERFNVLMSYGSVSGILAGGHSAADTLIKHKARSVFFGLLRGMDSPRQKSPYCSMISAELTLQILRFMGDSAHVPVRNPETKWVSEWLIAVYASLRGGFRYRSTPEVMLQNVECIRRDFRKLDKFLPAKKLEIRQQYESLYQAAVRALVLIGECEVFFEERDILALPELSQFTRSAEKQNKPLLLPSLEAALLHSEHVSSARFRAAAVAIALRYLKEGQHELVLD